MPGKMRPIPLKISVDQEYKKRFFDKVVKIPFDDCWYWTGQINTSGYAYFKMRQKYYVASRISYAIHNGDMPQNRLALHKCDNPICVNPDHIFLGTDLDNNRDMANKGRRIEHNSLKTHCVRGHELSGENLIIEEKVKRRCRICRRAKNSKRAEKEKIARHLEGRVHNRQKTHCPKDHPYAGDNLRIGSNGQRCCRACDRNKKRKIN